MPEEIKYKLFRNSSAPKSFLRDAKLTEKLSTKDLETLFDSVALSFFSPTDLDEIIIKIEKKSKLSSNTIISAGRFANYVLKRLSWKFVDEEIVEKELEQMKIPRKVIKTVISVYTKYKEELWKYTSEKFLVLSPIFNNIRWRVGMKYQDSIRPPFLQPVTTIAIICNGTSENEEETIAFDADLEDLDNIIFELETAKKAMEKLKNKTNAIDQLLRSE